MIALSGGHRRSATVEWPLGTELRILPLSVTLLLAAIDGGRGHPGEVMRGDRPNGTVDLMMATDPVGAMVADRGRFHDATGDRWHDAAGS